MNQGGRNKKGVGLRLLIVSKVALQLGPVETYHYFAIHNGDWRCHVAESFQFSQSAFIGSDVAVGIIDLVLRKKLFHFGAKHSSGLAVKNHLLVHWLIFFSNAGMVFTTGPSQNVDAGASVQWAWGA